MSVYVDPLRSYGGKKAPRCFQNKPSCHMYADSLPELHATARKLGMKKEWFQDNIRVQHYDLVPAKRKLAIELGAIEHSTRQMVEWRRARNPIGELCEILREGKIQVTFSKNCCSGIVHFLGKAERCECWRCRRERGDAFSAETEKGAAELSQRAQRAMHASFRKAMEMVG